MSKKSSTFAGLYRILITKLLNYIFFMMKHFFTHVTLVGLFGLFMLFQGCDAGVDLNNIDTSVKVKASSLALPIGSIRAELGDFLGDTVIPNIGIDEGCYVYRDTFYSTRHFHPIDLSSYVSMGSSTLYIQEQLVNTHPELAMLPAIVFPADTSFYIDFVMPFNLEGINSDLAHQRMDSAIISEAHFTSNIQINNLSTLTWDEIEKVEIILDNEHFRRASSHIEIPIDGYNFGKNIPISVNDFHLIMMKDINADPSNENILDSVNFTMRFHLRTKRQHVISEDAAIVYGLNIDFIAYDAIFGYFQASNQMRDERTDIPFTDFWSGWDVLDGFILPVREPSVFIGVDHALAMPLLIDLQRLSVKSKTGEEKFVSFDGHKDKQIHMPPHILVTDPLTAHAHDTIHLDYTPANGNLADIMTIHPDFLSYKFSVDADSTYTEMKQYRIVDESDINLAIGVDIPFKFNAGTNLYYEDTIRNVNIESWELDSLIQNSELIDTINAANLTLFLTIENYLPFAITGKFEFLDSIGTNISFNGVDSISLTYPVVENYIAIEPSTCNIEIQVEEDDLHKLASIRAIKYRLTLGENTDPVDLTPEAALKIYIGVTGDVETTLNIEQLFNKDNTEE